MEDQPVFFFDQAEQDNTGEDEEYTENSIEDTSKKKKKKKKELWAKLFDNKEVDQPKSEHKGFFNSFRALFSKFAGVEKEEIADTNIETSHKIGSLGIGLPQIENIETTFADDEATNQQNEKDQFKKEIKNDINNDIEITNNDEKNNLNEKAHTNYENLNQIHTEIEEYLDSENQMVKSSINESNKQELSSSSWANEQDGNVSIDTEGEYGLRIIDAEEIKKAENIIGENIDSRSINTDQSIKNETGASLLGAVAAEELSKSNNEKLKKQAQKIKKHIEKTRHAEEKTKRELDELKKKQERQQAELIYKRFRTTKTELANDKQYNQPNFTNLDSNKKNNTPEDRVVPEKLARKPFDDSKKKYQEIERKMYEDKQKLENDMTQNNREVSKINNEIVENPNLEGRFITEQERDQQQEKLKRTSLLTKSDHGSTNGRATEPSVNKPQTTVSINNQQVLVKTDSQGKVFRYDRDQKIKEYKIAVKQGFSAGIIVLVSFLVVVLVWSLVN